MPKPHLPSSNGQQHPPVILADPRTPFQKFQDLARQVLTTPKAEALKHEKPKAKREKRGAK